MWIQAESIDAQYTAFMALELSLRASVNSEDRPRDEASGDLIEIAEPAAAHLRDDPSTVNDKYDSEDEREATELRPITNDKLMLPRVSRVLSPEKPQFYWYDPIKRFWRHNIRISVPHEDCRDHLGKLDDLRPRETWRVSFQP